MIINKRIIGYEFIYWIRPYLGRGRKDMNQAIVSKQVQINSNEIPIGWSHLAAGLFNKLTQRNPTMGFGMNGIEEIKGHKWFTSINWNNLSNKQITSPSTLNQEANFKYKSSI